MIFILLISPQFYKEPPSRGIDPIWARNRWQPPSRLVMQENCSYLSSQVGPSIRVRIFCSLTIAYKTYTVITFVSYFMHQQCDERLHNLVKYLMGSQNMYLFVLHAHACASVAISSSCVLRFKYPLYIAYS